MKHFLILIVAHQMKSELIVVAIMSRAIHLYEKLGYWQCLMSPKRTSSPVSKGPTTLWNLMLHDGTTYEGEKKTQKKKKNKKQKNPTILHFKIK
jgi:hypothetical protein